MLNPRVARETVVLLAHRRKLPNKPSRTTLYCWRKTGLVSKISGKRITLEWCRYGGLPATSLEAYDRFMQRLNGE